MHRFVLLLVGMLALAACGSAPAGSGPVDPATDGEWQLVAGTVDGQDLVAPPGATATLDLADGEARGISFCNHWFATYRADAAALSFDGIGGTEMGCDPDVMAAESAFLRALGEVREAALDGEDLVLTGDRVELRFSPVAPVPDSPLADTRWVLDTLVDGEVASTTLGEPAVLMLRADGGLQGSTGCRSLTGSWLLEEGSLAVDDLLSDDAACPPDVERQDEHVTGVLAAGPEVEIHEDRLTLTADARGLIYRAQPGTADLLGSWALVEGTSATGPLPVPDGARGTLTLSPGSLATGMAFCNGFGGTYTLEGNELRLADTAHTLMGCEGPVGEAEGRYLEVLLDRSHRAQVDGDRLVLVSDAGTLVFDRLPPVPLAELTDRRWELEAVVRSTGTAGAGAPAVLELRSDGTATVSTGCREFEASWRTAGDAVQLADWQFELLDCPPEVADQDESLVQVLGGAFGVHVEGDVLTVGGVDTRGAQTPTLSYRAR